MRWRALWLGMLVVLPAGCLTDRPVKSTSFIDRALGMGGPTGPDAVFIEYALIERPAGSAAINHEVWENIDEQIIPSDTKALLAENGLRAGIASGWLSPELEAMIANPKSATGHRHRRLYVGNPADLTVNGPVALAEYQIRHSMTAEPASMKYEQAKFSISITPNHAANGRIALQCVPEVEYQDKKSWLPAGAVGPGWINSKPIEPLRVARVGIEAVAARIPDHRVVLRARPLAGQSNLRRQARERESTAPADYPRWAFDAGGCRPRFDWPNASAGRRRPRRRPGLRQRDARRPALKVRRWRRRDEASRFVYVDEAARFVAMRDYPRSASTAVP